MAQTFHGDVDFTLHDKCIPHRFEVSVTADNTIVLWIEERQSKKQWQTNALEASDFITENNIIPKATAVDYAERFAACLTSTNVAKYNATLSTKGGDRVLVFTFVLQWVMRDISIDYKFVMKEVPLERIDILSARMRDVEEKMSESRLAVLADENAALKTETKRLKQRVDELEREILSTPLCAQARTRDQHSSKQTLVWSVECSNTSGVVEILPTGSICFRRAGLYTIDIGVTHSGVSDNVIFELVQSGFVLASVQGCSRQDTVPVCWGYGHLRRDAVTTTTLHYVLKAKANDEISVVYKAGGSAKEGSVLMIAEL